MAVWKVFIRAFLAAVGVIVPAFAFAADTGTVSGSVFDQNGEPVAEATVKASGASLPVGRTVLTGANGTFRFEYLLPGEYEISIESGAARGAVRRAVVEVGKDTQLDFVVGLELNEAVTVTAASPVVDVKSTEVSFNFKSDTLSALPLERTYRGMFQLVPGVADNRISIGPSAGGTRQDNTYLLDGANITSPAYGYLSGEVNQLDIAEVNVKRAGISAEFGRTGGVVTNAVSRSGSNTLSGVARFDWLPENLVNAYKLPQDLRRLGLRPGALRDPLLTTEVNPAGGIGGPIMKDRMFFYASARYSREAKWNRFNKVGTPLPDEVRTGPELYGKVTAVPTMAHQLTVGFRNHPNHVEHAVAECRCRSRRRVLDGQRLPNWHRRVGELHDAQHRLERPLPAYERTQRGRSGHQSRLPSHLRPEQSRGDGPIHGSRSGEPRDWRRGVQQHTELPPS